MRYKMLIAILASLCGVGFAWLLSPLRQVRASHVPYAHDEGSALNAAGVPLPFVLLLPPGHDEPEAELPLILFLHGAGLRGTDNRRQLDEPEEMLTVTQGRNSRRFSFCNRDPICIASLSEYDERFASYVLAPQVPRDFSWSSFIEVVHELVERSLVTYNIDRQRIYVIGFSMGSPGMYRLLETAPDLFAAGVSVAGGGNPSVVNSFRNVPTWLFHGENDPTVPVLASIEMHDALLAVGADSQLTLLPNAGHLVLDDVLRSPDYAFYEWLFGQSTIPEPSAGALVFSACCWGFLNRPRRVLPQRSQLHR